MLAVTPKSSVIQEIERLGFKWQDEPQFELGKLSTDRRVQVRDSEHYAPKQQVAQYAVQMKETQFPPMIVTANDWLVDGNTRQGAYLKNKIKFGHVIVLDVEYGKSDKVNADIEALAATLNQQGGQRLTPSEARNVASTLIDRGWKPDAIGRATGVKSSVVANIKRENAANAKFAKVGFKKADKLASAAVLRGFGMEPVYGLNDVPFKKLAELAVDANLGSTEVRDIANQMKLTGSDTGMIDLAEGKRAEMSERIREHSLMGNGKPAPSSQLRRHLGFVLNFSSNTDALIERAPAAMADHLRDMENAVTILQAAIAEQGKLIDA